MWRNIATMIYGWHEQMQPGGAGGEYTLVFATLCCQDTVRIMPYSFPMPDETVATRLPWLDSSLPRHPFTFRYNLMWFFKQFSAIMC